MKQKQKTGLEPQYLCYVSEGFTVSLLTKGHLAFVLSTVKLVIINIMDCRKSITIIDVLVRTSHLVV